MKGYLNTLIGIVGAALTLVFGELTPMLVALCIAMLIDYVSGMVVALVFKNSPNTESGKASSEICIRGLVKKMFMLVLVGLGNRLDIALNVEFVKMGIIYAFLSNEVLSIVENATLMGIPVPEVIKNALDILNGKNNEGGKYLAPKDGNGGN
mgnify:FL=1